MNSHENRGLQYENNCKPIQKGLTYSVGLIQ